MLTLEGKLGFLIKEFDGPRKAIQNDGERSESKWLDRQAHRQQPLRVTH